MALLCLAGCNDRYDEGYAAGYNAGVEAGEKLDFEKAELEQSAESQVSQHYNSSTYITSEVCGGGGVNVNGKHYSGGKTGCVRVLSDGTVQRY